MRDRTRALILTISLIAVSGCGSGDPEIDLDAGVRTHLEVTDQSLGDIAGRCSSQDESLCGVDFLRRVIEDQCRADVDDATDQASWRLTRETIGIEDRIQVMSVACPQAAAEWIAYELGS